MMRLGRRQRERVGARRELASGRVAAALGYGSLLVAAFAGPESLLLLPAAACCCLTVPRTLAVGLHCDLSGSSDLLCF